MMNTEREAIWCERVEHWRASGLSEASDAPICSPGSASDRVWEWQQ